MHSIPYVSFSKHIEIYILRLSIFLLKLHLIQCNIVKKALYKYIWIELNQTSIRPFTVQGFSFRAQHPQFFITELFYTQNQKKQSIRLPRRSAITKSVELICQQGRRRNRLCFQRNTEEDEVRKEANQIY